MILQDEINLKHYKIHSYDQTRWYHFKELLVVLRIISDKLILLITYFGKNSSEYSKEILEAMKTTKLRFI